MTSATNLTENDTTPTSSVGMRLTDAAAHRHAIEHAVAVLGLDAEPHVVWDLDHHLQGHFDVAGRHLVLIAPRTRHHAARLLSEDEWDGLRRGLRAA